MGVTHCTYTQVTQSFLSARTAHPTQFPQRNQRVAVQVDIGFSTAFIVLDK